MSILEHTPHTDDEDRAPAVWLPNKPGASTRTYRGKSLEQLLPKIRRDLGDDAVVLRERQGLMGGVGGFFATRFVEVEARAGASIDVYDEDDVDGAAARPALPAPAAEEMPALPAPSEFSTQLQEAVQAWTADLEERDQATAAAESAPVPELVGAASAAVPELVGAEPAAVPELVGAASAAVPGQDSAAPAGPEPACVESSDAPLAAPVGASDDPREMLPAIVEPTAALPGPARRTGKPRTKLPRKPAAPRPVDSDTAARVLGELIELGISDGFARELIGTAAAHGCVVAGGLRSAVRAELTRRLEPTASLPAHGGAIAFVGAGGSGKSLATAALAATYRYGSSLGISVASLCESFAQRHLADTLSADGVPVSRLPEPGARGAATSLAQIASDRRHGLVILDTPAVTPTDPAAVAQLAVRLREVSPDAIYLVLSATLGATAARRALEGLSPLAPTGIVISHADETDQVGVLIELAATEGLGVPYLTAGADHRRSLIGTDPAALAQLVLP